MIMETRAVPPNVPELLNVFVSIAPIVTCTVVFEFDVMDLLFIAR